MKRHERKMNEKKKEKAIRAIGASTVPQYKKLPRVPKGHIRRIKQYIRSRVPVQQWPNYLIKSNVLLKILGRGKV